MSRFFGWMLVVGGLWMAGDAQARIHVVRPNSLDGYCMFLQNQWDGLVTELGNNPTDERAQQIISILLETLSQWEMDIGGESCASNYGGLLFYRMEPVCRSEKGGEGCIELQDLAVDVDGDRILDAYEIGAGFDPDARDSDGDGVEDGLDTDSLVKDIGALGETDLPAGTSVDALIKELSELAAVPVVLEKEPRVTTMSKVQELLGCGGKETTERVEALCDTADLFGTTLW